MVILACHLWTKFPTNSINCLMVLFTVTGEIGNSISIVLFCCFVFRHFNDSVILKAQDTLSTLNFHHPYYHPTFLWLWGGVLKVIAEIELFISTCVCVCSEIFMYTWMWLFCFFSPTSRFRSVESTEDQSTETDLKLQKNKTSTPKWVLKHKISFSHC